MMKFICSYESSDTMEVKIFDKDNSLVIDMFRETDDENLSVILSTEDAVRLKKFLNDNF